MDESPPAEISEDAMENNPNEEETSPGKDADPSTGDHLNRVFCCRDCGEAFRDEAAFSEHCSQHPQDNLCSGDQLDGGQKDCATPHFCTFCSLSFVELSDFDRHMKTHEQLPKETSGGPMNSGTAKHPTYECPDCGKCYGVIGHFLNHQRSHRPPSKSVFHDLEHLKKKSFQCETCGRSYSRASALDAHRRCHEEKLIKSKNKSPGDAPPVSEPAAESKPSEPPAETCLENLFKCVCGKSFSALYRLKTHQRFSRNSQCAPEELKQKTKKSFSEFSCHQCNKVFNGHLALYNHQRWHANQSPDSSNKFPCEECGKVFMTLTFYYRHRRMAHGETPSKSFLHQVCQVQKKAFECEKCGLKFSRASALHAHQLHHTDAFTETEKGAQTGFNLLTQELKPEICRNETDPPLTSLESEVQQESLCPASTAAETPTNESEDDMESYEPGDFNVQVISASESEGEEVQDANPDLELLCESDQEARDDADFFLHKPEMDLKIVQIDFDQAEEPSAPPPPPPREAENKQRFRCPECHRWFPSPSSLRMHRTCHGVHKRRHQIEETEGSIQCEDCGLKFEQQEDYVTHLHQHALEEEDGTAEDDRNSPDLISWRVEEEEGKDVSSSGLARVHGDEHSYAPNGEPRHFFTCSVCGKIYIYQVSFRKHLKLHENPSPQPKKNPVIDTVLPKYDCPDCGLSFIRKTRLLSHLRVHRSRRTMKESIPACEQCNRSFNSVKSWMAHLELHRQKPFWCLSCALGFLTEESLDKHLQNHSLKPSRRTKKPESFKRLPKARHYKCSLCGKSFYHPKKLFAHKKKKHKWHMRNGGMATGDSALAEMMEDIETNTLLSNINEEPGANTDVEELLRPEEDTQENTSEHPEQCDDDGADPESSDSDCGEPSHCIRVPKPPDAAGSDDSKSGAAESQTKEKIDGMHREHKYWKWECFECDMGFDEMAGLHLHYIKHATGEIPMMQDDDLAA